MNSFPPTEVEKTGEKIEETDFPEWECFEFKVQRQGNRARSFQHRGQRLGPRGRGACRAAAPPTPQARAWELRPLFTLRSRAGKDRKGGAVVVTFLSFGVVHSGQT